MGYQPEKRHRGQQKRCPWYQEDDTRGQLGALLAPRGRFDSMTGVDLVVRAASPKEKNDSLSLPEEVSKRDSSKVVRKKRGHLFC